MVVNIDEAYTKSNCLVSLLLIFLLNVFGLKKVEKTQLFIVSVSIISLIVIIVLSFNSLIQNSPSQFSLKEQTGLLRGLPFYIFLMQV